MGLAPANFQTSRPRIQFLFLLLLLLFPVACVPSAADDPEPTAVPPTATVSPTPPPARPTEPPPTEPPAPTTTVSPVPTATVTPAPPTATPLPPPTGAAPEGLVLAATLDFGDVGQVIELRPAPGLTGLLQLVTEQGYATIRPEDGRAWFQPAYPGATVIGLDEAGFIWMFQEDGTAIYATDGLSDWAFGPESGWTPVVDFQRLAGRGIFQDNDEVEIVPNVYGHLWLATDQDFRRSDGRQWTVFEPATLGMGAAQAPDLISQFVLRTFAFEPAVWVGGCDWGGPGPFGGRGARWWDGQSWQGADSPLADGCVTALAGDAEGNVWVGRDGELWRYESASGTWTPYPLPAPEGAARVGYVMEIALDRQGSPWPLASLCGGASCDNGAQRYRLQDGQWQPVGEIGNPYLPQWLLFDAANRPWLATAVGLFGLAGSGWQPVVQADVLVATVGEDGRLWLITPSSDGAALALWEFQPD